ncbi:hypothetical protein [Priestia sp. GS2]|uniref:hypothetical protein n=1 Tax=Priestia sp. GS2 TaxID=3117403 RepID=UPI002ED87FB6
MKTNIIQANEILNESSGRYRELTQRFTSESSKIRQDIKLSDEGKRLLLDSLKEDYKDEVKRLKTQVECEYLEALQKAKADSERVLEKTLAKPSEKELSKYAEAVNELKTNVLLALNPGAAQETVTKFAAGINDPYIANQFKQEFGNIIGPIIVNAGASAPGIKQTLAKTYEHLSTGFMTDEALEARHSLEQVEQMQHAKVFSGAVLDNVKATFGEDVVKELEGGN